MKPVTSGPVPVLPPPAPLALGVRRLSTASASANRPAGLSLSSAAPQSTAVDSMASPSPLPVEVVSKVPTLPTELVKQWLSEYLLLWITCSV